MMILVESPAYLLDSGFLLSFGCVLGMGHAAEKICALAGAEKKWTKALVSPIALQLVTLPVMLKFFGEVSIAGFILNLFVLSSVGVVLTGGMAALLLGILSIPAANWCSCRQGYCCFFMNISAVWQESQDGVPGSEGSRKYGRSWYIMVF